MTDYDGRGVSMAGYGSDGASVTVCDGQQTFKNNVVFNSRSPLLLKEAQLSTRKKVVSGPTTWRSPCWSEKSSSLSTTLNLYCVVVSTEHLIHSGKHRSQQNRHHTSSTEWKVPTFDTIRIIYISEMYTFFKQCNIENNYENKHYGWKCRLVFLLKHTKSI